MRDIAVNLALATSIAPAVLAATATGATVDLLGCNAAAVIISTGAIAGSGKFASKLQESDDGGTWTDVAAADILGTLPAELAASTTYKASYRGFKRYIRPVLTLVSGTSIAATAIVAKSALTQRPAA